MNEDDVVAAVLDRLERLDIQHMLVGSYASNVYGRPRGSFDADVVVNILPSDVPRLVRAFESDFVLDEEALARDVAAGRMFNLIPMSGLFKVDIIPVRNTDFAKMEFSRRRRIRALGRTVWIASPEDTILSKLAWFRMGGEVSARQVEDARDVYALQMGTLDESYIDHWADALGVRKELDRIRSSI
ncbi:MAG: hypothetical protein HYY16_07535 [Planctomycetes bacterium]|nr:hypothetical protein [Planctomycetota bacterium]